MNGIDGIQKVSDKIKSLHAENSLDVESTEDYPNVSLVLNWSEQNVQNWFIEKGLTMHKSIVENFKKCDGKLLYEFYLIKKEAPIFFYEKMFSTCNEQFPLKDYTYFSKELKDLFEK